MPAMNDNALYQAIRVAFIAGKPRSYGAGVLMRFWGEA
ncbi:hypothetical protein C4K27_1379 [Pseudomonas chlororaphis subsp. chlororaphis]|nr:hypothetical protein C4K27_1379 [Pseudomonas chlororaphis subsp. chlororaphis]